MMVIRKATFRVWLICLLVSINIIIWPIDMIGVDRGAPIVVFCFLLVLLTFIAIIFGYKKANLCPRPILTLSSFFLILVVFPLLISILVNSPIEYAASILRFTSYFMCVLIFYYASKIGAFGKQQIFYSVCAITFICLVVSLHQVATENLIFMNGAERLSSIYGSTPAGLALLMLMCSVYLFSTLMFDVLGINKFVALIFFLLSFWMMYATQSRQAIVTFLIVCWASYFIVAKPFFKIVSITIAGLVSLLFYFLVMHTNALPRITDMVVRSDTDSSTATRIYIIQESLNGMNDFTKVFGIGLGGFNHFFYEQTGELGVAAHNDFLLFFVEGGIFVFLAYVIFLITVCLFFLRLSLRLHRCFIVPFSCFLAIYILSFLNNPYYYPQVQVLCCAIFGCYINRARLLRMG